MEVVGVVEGISHDDDVTFFRKSANQMIKRQRLMIRRGEECN